MRKRRKRQIIWFNPPFNKNVTTNIGQKFFQLLSKHFPPSNKYSKIFNRNTVKLSYSCTPNVGVLMKQSNAATMRKFETIEENNVKQTKKCNCKDSKVCPLNGSCLESTVVYEATLDTNTAQSYTYIGLTEGTFKSRFYGHSNSFRHENQENSTELSKKVWELKRNGTSHNISWRIRDKTQPYKEGAPGCNLCTTEKYHILTSQAKNLLNTRKELISKCRHMNKFMLKNVKFKTRPHG